MSQIYRNKCDFWADELNPKIEAEVAKIAKSLNCENYLIATTSTLPDECGSELKRILNYVVKDSLRWVKIDFNKMGNMSFTLTFRSISTAKMISIPEIDKRNELLAFTLLPLCKEGGNFSEKDTNVYLQITIKAQKSETQHLLFQTFKQSIYFREISDMNCKFYSNPIMKESEANEIYKKMAENVKYIGKAMKEQNDAQNQKITKECKYKDKMMFDAMEMTTVEDIKRFLSYCVLRPDTYRRNTWALPEVYATWLVAGMPLPNK